MRRGYAWILALLLVLTLLTGCGGSGGDNAASEAAAGETVESTASDAAAQLGRLAEESPAAPAAEGRPAGRTAGRRQDDLHRPYGGGDHRLRGRRLRSGAAGGGDGRLLRAGGGPRLRRLPLARLHRPVPAERFQDLLAQVGELCHVTYQEQNSDNVSEAYYDTESRLVTQQTKLERLQTLLAQAETMEDIITIESAHLRDGAGHRAAHRDPAPLRRLVDFATVTISLQEVYQLSNVEEPATTFGSGSPPPSPPAARLCQRPGELRGGPGLRLGVGAAAGGDRRGGAPPAVAEPSPEGKAPGPAQAAGKAR